MNIQFEQVNDLLDQLVGGTSSVFDIDADPNAIRDCLITCSEVCSTLDGEGSYTGTTQGLSYAE